MVMTDPSFSTWPGAVNYLIRAYLTACSRAVLTGCKTAIELLRPLALEGVKAWARCTPRQPARSTQDRILVNM